MSEESQGIDLYGLHHESPECGRQYGSSKEVNAKRQCKMFAGKSSRATRPAVRETPRGVHVVDTQLILNVNHCLVRNLKPSTNQTGIVIVAKISSKSIVLVAISLWLAILSQQRLMYDTSIIRIYHKDTRPTVLVSDNFIESNDNGAHSSNRTSGVERVTSASENKDQAIGDDEVSIKRHATIEFSSPMKRIMDLIGQHAPVIVMDSSGGQDSQPPATVGSAQPIQIASTSLLSQSRDQQEVMGQQQQQQQQQQPQHFVGVPRSQLETQQHHWTLMDANQMISSQQQQPMAQHQPLIQTSAPNEQYFTFTPFGLAPLTSNPFGLTAGGPQITAGETHAALNPYSMTGLGGQQFGVSQQQQQLTQSSQNLQQQVSSEPAQPVFLSSYVPELPVPVQTNQGPPVAMAVPNLPPSSWQAVTAEPRGFHQAQAPAQQPNSIQQIQQAQQQVLARPGGSKSQPKRVSDSHSHSDSAGGAEEDEKPLREEPNGSGGGGGHDSESDHPDPDSDSDSAMDTAPHGNGASSGSSSYEDKYDSDRDTNDVPAEQSLPSRTQARSSSLPLAPSGSDSRAHTSTTNSLVGVGLNDDCLQCICRASSGCDHLLRCITIGADDKYCGPFQLTEEYWQKAGSPGDSANNFSSFEECANDADCAVETVTNYMKKYYKDCDGDDNITCIDYARLHRLRPDECNDSSKLGNELESYWQKFQRCAESYNRTRNGDDEDI